MKTTRKGRPKLATGVRVVDDQPPEVFEIARRRTSNILYSLRLLDFRLDPLAESCYLQGVRDAYDAVIHRPDVVAGILAAPAEEVILEFEI